MGAKTKVLRLFLEFK